MSGLAITLTTDTITPDLAALAAAAQSPDMMRAVGVGFVALAKRAFNEPNLRPTPWAAKKDGTPATLKKLGNLFRSIAFQQAGAGHVSVASDRAYAAIHQLGGVTRPMPARPFFPFEAEGYPTAAADRMVTAVVRAWLDKRGAAGSADSVANSGGG